LLLVLPSQAMARRKGVRGGEGVPTDSIHWRPSSGTLGHNDYPILSLGTTTIVQLKSLCINDISKEYYNV